MSIKGNVTPISNFGNPEMLRNYYRYQLRLQNIAKDVRDKQCILFLGSAIHAPSDNSNYHYSKIESLPFASEVSELLATECGYPDPDNGNLSRVSWYYEWQSGFRGDLIDRVREIVLSYVGPPNGGPKTDEERDTTLLKRKPSPVLCGLARLPFPLVITTNYDQMYEEALELVAQERAQAAGKNDAEIGSTKAVYKKSIYSPLNTVSTEDCEMNLSDGFPYLLKIHGDLDKPDSIVITDEDYIHFVMRMGDKEPYNPVAHNVRYHLKERSILFIGYSLSDYNLRLLFKTLRHQLGEADLPSSFAVDNEPDVLIREVWDNQRRHIRFIEKNLWDFVPDLYREVMGQEMPQ
jgi:hypothetical protein